MYGSYAFALFGTLSPTLWDVFKFTCTLGWPRMQHTGEWPMEALQTHVTCDRTLWTFSIGRVHQKPKALWEMLFGRHTRDNFHSSCIVADESEAHVSLWTNVQVSLMKVYY